MPLCVSVSLCLCGEKEPPPHAVNAHGGGKSVNCRLSTSRSLALGGSLELVEGERVFSDDVPNGVIISQAIPASSVSIFQCSDMMLSLC